MRYLDEQTVFVIDLGPRLVHRTDKFLGDRITVYLLLGDTLGTRSKDPAATAQWLLLPQLIFGFLSVGIQPLQRFPEWIQPLVRHQPISRIVDALRAFAGDAGDGLAPVTWSVVTPALAWLVGIAAVTVPWAFVVYRRRA